MSVRVGDRVNQGQIIGRMGRTGSATGFHLHFEIRRNGTALDPMNFYAP
jgi:murein DD-endopeptidase MepM/ murein hydrolase activator NlpD